MNDNFSILEKVLISLKYEYDNINRLNDKVDAQIQSLISFCALIISLMIFFMAPGIKLGHGAVYYLVALTVFILILIICFFLISRNNSGKGIQFNNSVSELINDDLNPDNEKAMVNAII